VVIILGNGTEYLENRTATYVLTAASDLHKHEDGNLRMDNLGRNTNVNRQVQTIWTEKAF